MLTPSVFWPWFAGLISLGAGLFVIRRELARAPALEKLIRLGPVFVAAPLAVFGAEHLSAARFIMQAVPPWMPGRLFWAYFVGVALLAAATSIVARKCIPLSATLSGVMFVLFVLMIHLPRAVANPRDRFAWTVVVRELAFAGGVWALAGNRLAALSRFLVGIPVIFFSVEHFLHPTFAPGVPLSKVTPAWVPFPVLWGLLTGAVLLAGGISLLAGKRSRIGAASIGLVMTLLTVFLYLPILLMASQAEMTEAVNYVADTLLFAGTLLCVAGALPRESPV